MVKQTIFGVAIQDIKPVHKGIKFEVENNNLRLISCDGFRLAIRNEAIEYSGENMTFVVPAKTLSEVVKLADDDESDISFSIGQKFILFQVGSFRIISRLLEGEFFNYKNAIPAESSTKSRLSNSRSSKVLSMVTSSSIPVSSSIIFWILSKILII